MQNTAIAWLPALLLLSPSLLTHLHCSSPTQWRSEGSRTGSEQHAAPCASCTAQERARNLIVGFRKVTTSLAFKELMQQCWKLVLHNLQRAACREVLPYCLRRLLLESMGL